MNLVTDQGLLNADAFYEALAQKLSDKLQPTTTVSEPEKPINVQETAEHLGFDVQTIYRMVRKGDIPHHKKGARLFFFKSELNNWIKA